MKFIIFLLFIKLIVCLKNEEFCYQMSTNINNELVNCKETHNFECWNGLCSVGQKSCENLAVFLLIKKYGVKDFQKYKNKIETFMYIFCHHMYMHVHSVVIPLISLPVPDFSFKLPD